jgi:hypothetical protein
LIADFLTLFARNPKFEHVKPTIDTGASITKFLEKEKENGKYQGEFFFFHVDLLLLLCVVFCVLCGALIANLVKQQQ